MRCASTKSTDTAAAAVTPCSPCSSRRALTGSLRASLESTPSPTQLGRGQQSRGWLRRPMEIMLFGRLGRRVRNKICRKRFTGTTSYSTYRYLTFLEECLPERKETLRRNMLKTKRILGSKRRHKKKMDRQELQAVKSRARSSLSTSTRRLISRRRAFARRIILLPPPRCTIASEVWLTSPP